MDLREILSYLTGMIMKYFIKEKYQIRKNKFTYTFDNVEKDFEYWANYENPNFFPNGKK